MKSLSFTLAAALAVSGVQAAPSKIKPRAACSTAVTLSGNPFSGRALHANSFYASEVDAAVKNLTDSSLATAAAKVADIGTFLWLDTMDRMNTLFDDALAEIPCDEIGGFVIYDLPGRDCAALASNGELATGQLSTYKSSYIDPIVTTLKKYPNTAVALVIEPDSLPNLVTNSDKTACANAASDYKAGVAYALEQLNLPNVMMYIDAGHGGWLGWDANLEPGAEMLAGVYKTAGSPKQVRGISTNVAGWNAWIQIPGEFSDASDAQYDSCQDEERYVTTFGAKLSANGMPNYAIVDTGRNGVTGLRDAWGDWCNVDGAGFGVRPTSDTGNDLADAFVWVKPGGESDGTSDTSATRYDAFCGKDDAFKPAPEAGTWNQAYFEMLVKNAVPAL